MISQKQLDANRRNAEKSTGPKTPEGKAAVRFNALKHGMRARSTVLPFEDPEEFNQLYASLATDWSPQGQTECLHVEQLAIHQWLLRRLANFEGTVFLTKLDIERQMTLLERVSTQRARLEHSFSKTIRDLDRLQKQRPQRIERAEQAAQAEQADAEVAPEPLIPPRPAQRETTASTLDGHAEAAASQTP